MPVRPPARSARRRSDPRGAVSVALLVLLLGGLTACGDPGGGGGGGGYVVPLTAPALR